MLRAFCSRVKLEVDHPPLSSAEICNIWKCISMSPIYLQGVADEDIPLCQNKGVTSSLFPLTSSFLNINIFLNSMFLDLVGSCEHGNEPFGSIKDKGSV
jgi:hypothetical protein